MMRRYVGLACLIPVPLVAQIRASEVGTMSQIIDGTKLTIEYSRPRARGRERLFGTPAVHWGETWTPGANWATTLEVNKNIKLNGRVVPQGKYSVWMVVKQKGPWTLVLDPRVHRYHMDPPDSTGAQIRVAARVDSVPFTEVLTWSMPQLRINGGTLTMQWERSRVSMDVEVEPSLVMTLAAAEAAPYLGRYAYTEQDSSGKPGKTSALTITHEDGTLKARWDPDDPYFKKFALIRIAPDWFVPGVYDKTGQIYEVLKPDLVFEFTRANGRAAGFVMRDQDDVVEGKGVRKP
jgi:DUF2911 family protein